MASGCAQVTAPRAQVWIVLLAVRSLCYAVAYRANTDRLTGTDGFEVVEAIMSLRWFVTAFFVIGVLAVFAFIDGRERYVRIVGIAAVTFQLLFGLAILASGSWSPAGVSMLALAGLDVLILSAPFHPPLSQLRIRDDG